MSRLPYLLLATWVVVHGPARAAEPTRAAPLYALPADGTWVEYDWTATDPMGKEVKGTLRLSAVGGKVIDGTACRWVEIRKEYREGSQTKREYRKLLVAEKAFAAAPTLRDHVRAVIGQDGSAAPLTFSASRARNFVNMGFDAADASLKEVRAREKVSTPLGRYDARHVAAQSRSGERVREYDGWLTADVPFGCARFEVREGSGDGPRKTVFTATAARSGKGAKSEVDEARAR
jgi:hypothetical protein